MTIEVLTGHTGNIGRHFPASFIPMKTRLERSVSEMEAELRGLGSPISSFVHLAGVTTRAGCESDPEGSYQKNVVGAKKWFEAAARVGVRHFLFTSTSHVYGNPQSHHALSVNSPLNPLSLYARQKMQAEEVLQQLATQYPDTKLTIARLFTVLSPAMKPGFLFTNLHKRAQAQDFSPIRGLSYARDFLPMDEAVRQLTALSRWMEAPPVINICSGRPTTVRELAEKVFAEYGLSAERIPHGPPSPGDIEWLVGQPDPNFLSYLDKTLR